MFSRTSKTVAPAGATSAPTNRAPANTLALTAADRVGMTTVTLSYSELVAVSGCSPVPGTAAFTLTRCPMVLFGAYRATHEPSLLRVSALTGGCHGYGRLA